MELRINRVRINRSRPVVEQLKTSRLWNDDVEIIYNVNTEYLTVPSKYQLQLIFLPNLWSITKGAEMSYPGFCHSESISAEFQVSAFRVNTFIAVK